MVELRRAKDPPQRSSDDECVLCGVDRPGGYYGRVDFSGRDQGETEPYTAYNTTTIDYGVRTTWRQIDAGYLDGFVCQPCIDSNYLGARSIANASEQEQGLYEEAARELEASNERKLRLYVALGVIGLLFAGAVAYWHDDTLAFFVLVGSIGGVVSLWGNLPDAPDLAKPRDLPPEPEEHTSAAIACSVLLHLYARPIVEQLESSLPDGFHAQLALETHFASDEESELTSAEWRAYLKTLDSKRLRTGTAGEP